MAFQKVHKNFFLHHFSQKKYRPYGRPPDHHVRQANAALLNHILSKKLNHVLSKTWNMFYPKTWFMFWLKTWIKKDSIFLVLKKWNYLKQKSGIICFEKVEFCEKRIGWQRVLRMPPYNVNCARFDFMGWVKSDQIWIKKWPKKQKRNWSFGGKEIDEMEKKIGWFGGLSGPNSDWMEGHGLPWVRTEV